MYLKAVQIKGFKSFPSKVRLDFGPGVSVIVGPNGSGKSNVSDAIVWALGEQSAAAVRGQQMQDLLFGGAEGIPSAASAEVELIFDNSDGALDSGFSELSITRKLSRDGEGEYRINGARCRLIDVIEVLSDSGLGKEMHSVLSQGKVDEIVASKPKDRRLLVEEAAGLGKHRKRRRRAQLKIAKTRDNLDRVLDVEREARSRLKPLKRQAEAAETHARLELQSNELRAEDAADKLLLAATELEQATTLAAEAREARGGLEQQLAEVARLREAAEQRIASESAKREKATEALFSVRSVSERIEGARDRGGERAARIAGEIERAQAELGQLTLDVQPEVDDSRLRELEAELAKIEQQGRAELEAELVELRNQHALGEQKLAELGAAAAASRERAEAAETASTQARRALIDAQAAHAEARRERARIEGEHSAIDQFLRESVGNASENSLAQSLGAEPGYEQALAAVLGGRLRAEIVADIGAGHGFLDALGEDGGTALIASGAARSPGAPPAVGAERLVHHLKTSAAAGPVVEALLGDAWVVDSLGSLPEGFQSVAVTRSGRVYFAATGELRQAPEGGDRRILAEKNRRDGLAEKLVAVKQTEISAQGAIEAGETALASAEAARDQAHLQARTARVAHDEASGSQQGRARAIERRIDAGLADGPTAVRRAAIEAELKSERSQSEQLRRAAELQAERRNQLELRLLALRRSKPHAVALSEVLAEAALLANERIAVISAALDGDRAAGEGLAKELRGHATREAELQAQLRTQGEAVTSAEVRAQRARDMHAEADLVIKELCEKLGRQLGAATTPLDEARREEIAGALARIARRRELLGPINPLAQDEYAEAIAHVEELEAQRDDLETALKEMESLIKEIDKTIRTSFEETFASTSTHFEELIGRLFPGGSGKLELVADDKPKVAPALTAAGADAAEIQAAADQAEAELPEDPDEQNAQSEIEYGVEIKVQLPGSKSGRALTLLSGGERSLVALAFLFSVFLTRPCPFYIFDEAEAALDDVNIDRLVALLREHSASNQFIVITHQKRTMDAADCLYGVSMGKDGISKVVTRRLSGRETELGELIVA
jgi:chromosome segregation protein